MKQLTPGHRWLIACASLLLSFPFSGSAQGYNEGFSVSHEFMPLKIAARPGLPVQNFTGDDLKLSFSKPLFLTPAKSTYFLLGINYESLHFGGDHAGLDVKTVYSINPMIGYSMRLSRRWNLTAIYLPTLNSDLKKIHGSDIRSGGILRANYRVDSNFSIRATLGYRDQFFGPQYIVLLGLDWKMSDRWRVFGDIPNNATINYAVNAKINTGFNLTANYTSYTLSQQSQYFKNNIINTGLFGEYVFHRNWALRLTAAYSVTRKFEVMNDGDKYGSVIDFVNSGHMPVVQSPEVKNGLAFKLGLSYRVF